MTFTEQTGFRRAHPHGLCQTRAVLERCVAYTYGPTEHFVAYFRARCGIQIPGRRIFSSVPH